MIYPCDCYICNMTEKQQREENDRYVEWEYEQYLKTTDNPVPIELWLKQFEG